MTHQQAEPIESSATETAGTDVTESVVVAGSQAMRALIGAAIAIVGVVAAANPESAMLRALHQAMPQLADALPALITACGAIVAAFSQPPKLRHRPSAESGEPSALRLS